MFDAKTILLVLYGFAAMIILCGMLLGFLRGARKSLVYFIYYLVGLLILFFISIPIANAIYSANILSNFSSSLPSELQGASSIKELVPLWAKNNIQDYGETVAKNEHILLFIQSFVTMFIRFVVIICLWIVGKILLFIPRWLSWKLFFAGSKEQRETRSKHRGMGTLIGFARGAIGAIVFFIPISLGAMFVGNLDINFSSGSSQNAICMKNDLFGLTDFTKKNRELVLLETEETNTKRTFDVSNITSGDLGEIVGETLKTFNEYNESPVFKIIKACDTPIVNGIFGFEAGEGDNAGRVKFTKDFASLANVYLLLNDTGAVGDDGSIDYSKITENDIKQMFGYIGDTQIVKALLPMAADLGVTIAKDKTQTELDFEIEDLYKLNWGDEIKTLGNAAAYAYSALGGNFENVNVNSINMDKATDAMAELVKSKVVLMSISVAADYAFEGDTLKDYADYVNIKGMGENEWKADLSTLVDIAKEIKKLDIDYENIDSMDFEALLSDKDNNTAIKAAVNKLFTLNIISSKQDEILKLAFKLIPANDFINTDTINVNVVSDGKTYSQYIAQTGKTEEEWKAKWNELYKNEMMNIVDVVAKAMPLMDMDLEGGIENIDVDKVDAAIEAMTSSKIMVQVIDAVAREKFTSIDGVSIVIPDNLDWKVEGKSLCKVLKGAQANMEKGNDVVVSILLVDVDTIVTSKIMVASLPKTLEGDNFKSVISIPQNVTWEDELNTDGTIKKSGELRNVLVSLQTIIKEVDSEEEGLSIDTFTDKVDDISTIANMTDEELDDLFTSDIITLSVSKVIVDNLGETLTVPDSSYKSKADKELKKEEIIGLVKSAKQLEIIDSTKDSGINSDKVNFGLILKVDSTVLQCGIMHATISKYIKSADALIIPSSSLDQNGLVKEAEILGLKYSVSDAGFGLIKADGNINSSKVNAGLILKVSHEIIACDIMHATISNKIESASDMLVVPNKTGFTAFDSNNWVSEAELLALKQYLGETKLNLVNAEGNINEGKINAGLLLEIDQAMLDDSTILYATISKQIVSSSSTSFIIPDYSSEFTAYNKYDSLSVIKKTEILELKRAVGSDKMNLINNGEIDNTKIKPGLILSVDAQMMSNSTILRVTISSQLEANSDTLVIPDKIGYTAYDTYETKKVIKAAEIVSLGLSMGPVANNGLGIMNSDNNIDNSKMNAGLILNVTNKMLSDSIILHATISKQIVSSSDLIKPEETGFTAYSYEGTSSDKFKLITATEIMNLKAGVGNSGLQIVNEQGVIEEKIKPALLTVLKDHTSALDSVILQATISKQITNSAGTGKALSLPNKGTDCPRLTVYMDNLVYVTKEDIVDLCNVVTTLGLINSTTGEFVTVDYAFVQSIVSDTAKANEIENSAIIHYSTSKVIDDKIKTQSAVAQLAINTYITTNNSRYLTADDTLRQELLKASKMAALMDQILINS